MKPTALFLLSLLLLAGCDSSRTGHGFVDQAKDAAIDIFEEAAYLLNRKKHNRNSCIMNQRNVQQMTRGHQGMYSMRTGDEIDWDYMFGPRGYMPKPQCPAGGTYTYSKTVPPIGVLACTCSHATTKDHEPGSYSDW